MRPPPRGRRGLSRECTLGQSKGLKQSEMAGDAQPLELSRSVCMLHMDGEPELASLLLPACSSPASVMLSRRMSVAIDCSCMRRFRCTPNLHTQCMGDRQGFQACMQQAGLHWPR